MKKKSGISIGPGASSLILIFVALSLSVLGMLALMNGRNDQRLSGRSVQVIEAVYALNERAEEKRAALDAALCRAAAEGEDYWTAVGEALPEDVEWEDGVISWTESDGFRSLECALSVQPLDSENRAVWIMHDLTAETGEVW